MSRRSGTSASSHTSRVGLLTVGETARVLGVSPSTLRSWENVGLITAARSSGRYRLYSRDVLRVLKRIKYLRDVQLLTFPNIRRVLKTSRHAGHGKSAPATEVGSKLRRLRRRAGMGLVEAARRAKISPGFLSSIERSRANPSVATLQRLAATYGTTTLDFYGARRHSTKLVRPHERQAIQTESGVRFELLAPAARQLESQLVRVKPGAGSDGSYSHQGEEFIYMMAGTLEIWLDELECHSLNAGDSFWFESTVGHRWFNPSDTEAVLLWINTPLTF